MVEWVYADPESKENQTEHIDALRNGTEFLGLKSEVYCDLFALRIIISIHYFGSFF
jgi:hypothetical protein